MASEATERGTAGRAGPLSERRRGRDRGRVQALRRHPRGRRGELGVAPRSITALIVPNGAARRPCSTSSPASTGATARSVSFDGQVFGRPPYELARRGMVRTFQITKALAAMPVIDNMMLAASEQPGSASGT